MVIQRVGLLRIFERSALASGYLRNSPGEGYGYTFLGHRTHTQRPRLPQRLARSACRPSHPAPASRPTMARYRPSTSISCPARNPASPLSPPTRQGLAHTTGAVAQPPTQTRQVLPSDATERQRGREPVVTRAGYGTRGAGRFDFTGELDPSGVSPFPVPSGPGAALWPPSVNARRGFATHWGGWCRRVPRTAHRASQGVAACRQTIGTQRQWRHAATVIPAVLATALTGKGAL